MGKCDDGKLSRALSTIDKLQENVISHYDQIFTGVGRRSEQEFAKLY